MNTKATAGVYVIRNTFTGRQYIGSAVNIWDRWLQHRRHLRRGTTGIPHHNSKLQRAWNKYGEAAFEFSVLLICATKHLLLYEQRCLDCYVPAYNFCKVAGSILGTKKPPLSAEQRDNMRAAQLGKKHSDEHRESISLALRGKKKPPRSAEHNARIAKAKTGHKLPPRSAEHCAKLSKALLGKPFTEQRRAKMVGRKFGPEMRANVSKAKRGQKYGPPSAEHRANLSKAAKRRARSSFTLASG